MTSTSIAELAGDNTQALTPAQASSMDAEVARQIAMVQGAMAIAQKFRRDERAALKNILQTCDVIEFADEADYSFPRGGQRVSGASIRLVEECARQWGNIDYSVAEVSRQEGESLAQTYAVDLQTNTWSRRQFVVPHRRDKQEGGQDLKSDRDIYEMVANMGSRRVRACLEQVIPAYIVQAARDRCAETRRNRDSKEPLAERITKLIEAYSRNLKVSEAQLTKWAKRPVREILENEFQSLRGIYFAVKNGAARLDEHFEPATVADTITAGKGAPAAGGANVTGNNPASPSTGSKQSGGAAAQTPAAGGVSSGKPAAADRVADRQGAGAGVAQPSAATPARREDSASAAQADVVDQHGAASGSTRSRDDEWSLEKSASAEERPAAPTKEQILASLKAAKSVAEVSSLGKLATKLPQGEQKEVRQAAGARVKELHAAGAERPQPAPEQQTDTSSYE